MKTSEVVEKNIFLDSTTEPSDKRSHWRETVDLLLEVDVNDPGAGWWQ